MRRIVGVVLLLVLASSVGALVATDPGYVLLSWHEYSLETSIWFGGVLLLLSLLALWALIITFGYTFGSRGRFRRWRKRRREARALKKLDAGLVALSEGNPAKARPLLEAGAAGAPKPLVSRLAAARAAHEAGDAEGREALLAQALEDAPKATVAVGIARAEMAMYDQDYAGARAALTELREQAPKNTRVLQLLRTVCEVTGDWDGAAALLPALEKAGVLDESARADAEKTAQRAELLRASDGAPGPDRAAAVQRAWKAVPKPLRKDAEIIDAYVEALARAGDGDAAEYFLRRTLKKQWDERLVYRYGLITGGDLDAQIVAAQSWVPKRPNDATLLLTLGRLCLRDQRFARGREYLEAAFVQRVSGETAAELGRLIARQGEGERGARLLEQALALGAPQLPELPLPGEATPVVSKPGPESSAA